MLLTPSSQNYWGRKASRGRSSSIYKFCHWSWLKCVEMRIWWEWLLTRRRLRKYLTETLNSQLYLLMKRLMCIKKTPEASTTSATMISQTPSTGKALAIFWKTKTRSYWKSYKRAWNRASFLSTLITNYPQVNNVSILNCSRSGRKMSMSGSCTKVNGTSRELEMDKESELTSILSCSASGITTS